MPFASTNSTNPRTNPCNFCKKILRIGGIEKLSFFESAILIFFFQKKKFFFASFLSKLVTIYGVTRIFQNFDDYPGLQPQKQHLPKHMQHSVSVSFCIFVPYPGIRASPSINDLRVDILLIICHRDSQRRKCSKSTIRISTIWLEVLT